MSSGCLQQGGGRRPGFPTMGPHYETSQLPLGCVPEASVSVRLHQAERPVVRCPVPRCLPDVRVSAQGAMPFPVLSGF